MANTRYAYTAAGLLALAASVKGQAACTLTAETHPSLSWEACSSDGTCSSVSGSVAVDANWRWTHDKSSSTNCYTGNTWDATLCPDDETCFENCCVDGAEYESTYGVTSSGSALTLDFVTGSNIGSRLYLLANDTSYQGFTLLGNEFTFDVDVSNLPCGLNGALYFVSMDLDGGISKYNNSGPSYGTGYCDSQCPRDLKFIGGQANVDDWVSSTTNSNTGVGGHGACCSEMDVWEANKISNALTPHPCETSSYHECDGDNCGGTYSSSRYAGDCDPDGCDFNPYRQGNETFFGPSMTVDTSSVITVITQFVEESGALSAIRRFYVQNDVVIDQSESVVSGASGYNEINADFCSAQKTAFGDDNIFAARGGFTAFSTAVASPMVLVMSLWDDYYADMLWLDSTYPTNSTSLGAKRGTCATDSGVPSEVEADSASSKVIYSNIKFGPIGSTTSYTLTDSDSNSGAASSSAGTVAASSATTEVATSAATSAASSVEAATSATSAIETVATSAATSVASAATSAETTLALTSASVYSETTTAATTAATTTKRTCKRRIQTLAA